MVDDGSLENSKTTISPADGRREWDSHYEEWSDRVFRYLIHMIGSPDAAEDLFQETWLKALEHRGQLTRAENFGPWILRIARNLTLNQLRTRKRKGQVWILSNLAGAGDDQKEDLTERQASDMPGPRDQAIRRQRREIIQQAIGDLDPLAQEMLQLRYFEELTLAEIAEVLEVPLGTVCTKVHRGLKHIRKHLRRRGLRRLEEI